MMLAAAQHRCGPLTANVEQRLQGVEFVPIDDCNGSAPATASGHRLAEELSLASAGRRHGDLSEWRPV